MVLDHSLKLKPIIDVADCLVVPRQGIKVMGKYCYQDKAISHVCIINLTENCSNQILIQ